MSEYWVSDIPGRIPTVNQLELAKANRGYNRRDAKDYGLQIVGGVKTVVLLGQSTASNHNRQHAMDSSADHAAVDAADRGKIPQADPVTGEWKLVPMPTGGGTAIDQSTRLISGTVSWLQNLDFRLTNIVYKIWGVSYGPINGDITLAAADPDLPRRSLICGDINTARLELAGTPAENPMKPVPDPFTQFELTEVFIPAGATAPANITSIQVYDENTEWATSSYLADPTLTTIDFESTVTPVLNTKCIRITKEEEYGIRKAVINFNGAAVLLGADGTLNMRVRSSEAWNDSAIEFRLKRSGNVVGNSVILTGNNYGNYSTVPAWAFAVIPISDFSAGGQSVDEIEMRFSYTSWGPVGMLIDFDDIKFQFGASITPPGIVTSEIIIPEVKLDAGHYRETGDSAPMLDTLKASWESFNKEFLKYNPEIWVFRRKTYTRRSMLTESWTTDILNNAGQLTPPVTQFDTYGGDRITFANSRCEFSDAYAGEYMFALYLESVLLENSWYRVIFQVSGYVSGGIHYEFGNYVSMDFGQMNISQDLQFHTGSDPTKPFKIVSSFDGTTLNVDYIFIIQRERTYSMKHHKKWTHEPHLNGIKFEGSNYWAGNTNSQVDEISDNGRHTEFPCPLIPSSKLAIPIDPFEYYFGRSPDKVLHKIDENSTWSDYAYIVASGRESLSIPFRFAIVIDNPDSTAWNPKMIGPLSDIIYMRVTAPSITSIVTGFRQFYQYAQSVRKY